jgi:thioredoxin 1
MEVIFTDANFESEVLGSDTPVLVDFFAPWCGPCQMMGPVVDELAKKMGDKAKVGKINVDDNPETAQKYGVMSIPTIKIFKNGQIVREMTGVQSIDALEAALEEASK